MIWQATCKALRQAFFHLHLLLSKGGPQVSSKKSGSPLRARLKNSMAKLLMLILILINWGNANF